LTPSAKDIGQDGRFQPHDLPKEARCAYPPQKPCDYTFEEMMEPNFIMLKILLADGLKEPFADRAALFR